MMLRQHTYFTSNIHAREHTQVHTEISALRIHFFGWERFFFFFLDPVKQGIKLCTLQSCVHPAWEGSCQATGIAAMREKHYFFQQYLSLNVS